jgi:hypothetical protein
MFRHTAFAAAAAALLLTACDRKSDSPTAPATVASARLDTLRGVVKKVVNDDSTTSTKLTTADGNTFTLVGPYAGAIAADDGLEIWVQGELAADQFTVELYALRGGDSPTCQDAMIVDLPPDCLTTIEKLNPHRAHVGGWTRPR